MPAFAKLLIGFAAALAAGWASHGPLGRGAAFVDLLQAQTDAVIREAGLPGVTARFPARSVGAQGDARPAPPMISSARARAPLLGLNARVRAVPGVSDIAWNDNDCCARRQ